MWGHAWTVSVDMGGEELYLQDLNADPYGSDCRIGWGYSVDHEFFCPGTYEITAYDADHPDVLTSTIVTVSAPSIPFLFVFEDQSAYEAYLAVHVPIADRPFEYSTVDWGDGSVETFTWARRGLYMGTPTHLYEANGQYTASVTHHYQGQYCSFTQTMTAAVTIPNPGTPTRTTTWGAVKALYR